MKFVNSFTALIQTLLLKTTGVDCVLHNILKNTLDLIFLKLFLMILFKIQTCKDGEIVKGKCETTGDKRKCDRCDQKNHYYNKSQQICLPCTCHNMTAEIKRICSELDITLECNISTPSFNNLTTSSPHNNESTSSRNTLAIVVPIIVLTIVGVFSLYGCCVKKRVEKLRNGNPDLLMCSKEWFCQIFFFKSKNDSRPPSYHSDIGQAEERHALTSNGNGKLIFKEIYCYNQ